jgi:superfamily II DNA/RNA helicase
MYTSTAINMSHTNPKNFLLEKLARFKGSASQPRYDDIENPSQSFRTTLTVALTLNGQEKKWTVQTKDAFSTKKGAQFAAADNLLLNQDFLHHVEGRTWPLVSSGTQQGRPAIAQELDTLIDSTAKLTLANGNQHDQKGWLIEKLRQLLPRRSATFTTTDVAPFVSTVTVDMHPEAEDIIVKGHACSTKKLAEQSAARLALENPGLLCHFGVRVSSTDSLTPPKILKGCCADCQAQRDHAAPTPPAPAERSTKAAADLFQDNVTDSEFPTAPSTPNPEQEQNCTVLCKFCGLPVNRTHSSGGRTTSSPAGIINAVVVQETIASLPPRPNDTLPVRLPNDTTDREVKDLLSASCVTSGKVPKPEQLRAYQLALKDNQIVVFPTGFGKTFVASLLMHRFRKLNPSKLVVMVVDRVPLVQQQCEAIHRDTGMSVCPISGETNHNVALQALRNGCYAALVVTAGALCNFLRQDKLRLTDCSIVVLDECHHVTGEHPYTKILEYVAKCESAVQPRIVGLSASPISATTHERAVDRLKVLTHAMLGAKLYRPVSGASVMDGVTVTSVSRSAAQQSAITQLRRRLVQPVTYLCNHFAAHKPRKHETIFGSDLPEVAWGDHKFSWARAYNLAAEAHLFATDPKSVVEAAAKVRETVEALQTVSLLGSAFVRTSGLQSSVAEMIAAAATIVAQEDHSGLSPQLSELLHVLQKEGAAARTLVFVDMRHTAELLTSFLQQVFASLHCERLIGQGGTDGMKWRGMEGQGSVLDRFRGGETKLIVCTSVLEEGELGSEVLAC